MSEAFMESVLLKLLISVGSRNEEKMSAKELFFYVELSVFSFILIRFQS